MRRGIHITQEGSLPPGEADQGCDGLGSSLNLSGRSGSPGEGGRELCGGWGKHGNPPGRLEEGDRPGTWIPAHGIVKVMDDLLPHGPRLPAVLALEDSSILSFAKDLPAELKVLGLGKDLDVQLQRVHVRCAGSKVLIQVEEGGGRDPCHSFLQGRGLDSELHPQASKLGAWVLGKLVQPIEVGGLSLPDAEEGVGIIHLHLGSSGLDGMDQERVHLELVVVTSELEGGPDASKALAKVQKHGPSFPVGERSLLEPDQGDVVMDPVVAKVPGVGGSHGKLWVAQGRAGGREEPLHTHRLDPKQGDGSLLQEVDQVAKVDGLGSFTEGQGVGAWEDSELLQVELIQQSLLVGDGDLDQAWA